MKHNMLKTSKIKIKKTYECVNSKPEIKIKIKNLKIVFILNMENQNLWNERRLIKIIWI